MKKLVSIMLFMSVFFTMFAAAGQAAEVVPKLFLNGQLLKTDVSPQIINNSTVVPVRTVSEGLGYQINWDNIAKTATVINGNNVIKLKLNDKTAIVNGQLVQMDTSITIVKGKTLVPLRFVGEQFGLLVEWKNVEKEVHMYEKPTVPEVPVDPEAPTSTAEITDVSFDGANGVTISYNGTVKANKPLYLDNPKRIVFDLPGAVYSSNLTPLFVNGQVEVSVTDSTYLQGYRYSQFSKSPDIARLVFLVPDKTDYVMTENAGQIRFEFVSSEAVKPVDPNPTTPPVGSTKKLIVIDAGHGGSDPGAESILKRWEKEFTLSVALKMQALLEKDGKVKVVMTRTGDTYPSLAERPQLANSLKADLFISIHANKATAPSATGSETYYYHDNSLALAKIINTHLVAATKIRDRGVKKEAFKVIKDTTMPAVLVEAGFLSNTSDAKMLYDDASQNRISAELVAGMYEFLKVK